MKRARWSFILMSWGLSCLGGGLSAESGWIGVVGVTCLWAAGFTMAAAWGINFPKAMSNKWPDFYPPEKTQRQ